MQAFQPWDHLPLLLQPSARQGDEPSVLTATTIADSSTLTEQSFVETWLEPNEHAASLFDLVSPPILNIFG